MVIPTPLSYKLNLTLSQEIFQRFFTLRFEEVCLVIETLHRYTIFIPLERQGCCMKKRCLQAIVTLTGALFLFLTGQWQESCRLSTEYGDFLWKLKQRRTVQQGTYRITAHEEWNSYHLELNGKTILQVSPLGIFLVRLPYAVPFLMLFLLCFAIYKNRKLLINQAKNRSSWT